MKHSIRILFFFLLIFSCMNCKLVAGDSSQAEGPDIFTNVTKHLEVPQTYQNGVGWRDLESEYEKYLSNYRRGWWRCVEAYVNEIDYKYSESDSRISGWGSAISGFAKGYQDAEEMIQKNIKEFGKNKVHAYLTTIWEGN